VAGIAAGNSPVRRRDERRGARRKIVSVRACLFVAGCTAHALFEGMIYVAKQANVDVINMSIGGLPALNDGNNARAFLYDRLIEQYNVQMFISAGNSGPGMNTIGDPSVALKVMSVGAYITDDTYLAAYGAQLYEETTCTTSHRAARAKTAASSRMWSPPARPSRPSRCGRTRAAWPRFARSAMRSSTARPWRRRRRPAPARCWSARPNRPVRSTSPRSSARPSIRRRVS
jgi:hypothetical protein